MNPAHRPLHRTRAFALVASEATRSRKAYRPLPTCSCRPSSPRSPVGENSTPDHADMQAARTRWLRQPEHRRERSGPGPQVDRQPTAAGLGAHDDRDRALHERIDLRQRAVHGRRRRLPRQAGCRFAGVPSDADPVLQCRRASGHQQAERRSRADGPFGRPVQAESAGRGCLDRGLGGRAGAGRNRRFLADRQRTYPARHWPVAAIVSSRST